MMDKLADLLNRPFIRFALSGGLAAAANILSRMALSQITNYSAAIIIAYLIGMTTAYILMKLFVFEKSGRSVQHEYLRFGLVNLIALVQVWAVSFGLARLMFPWIGFSFYAETVAHIVGVLSPIFASYFMHKYFTFGSK